MPIYEYRCQHCGDIFEELMGFSDPDPVCPSCGASKPRKLISNTYFSLKGTGWYVTDYGSRSPNGRVDEKKSDRVETSEGNNKTDSSSGVEGQSATDAD